jgi:hypothetical protein
LAGLDSLTEPVNSTEDIATKLIDLLAACQHDHLECRQPDLVALPKRVLDVGSYNADVRLRETNGLRENILP